MKIWKIAEKWYKLAPTITLYHGTTEDNLNSILKNGFQPFDAQKKLDEILSRYGFTRDKVPSYIWFGEIHLREKQPYIYFTTNKGQAALYSQKPFGEFETSIVDALNRWLKDKKKSPVNIQLYKSVVITINAPWEEFKSYKSFEEYKEIVKKVKNMRLRLKETPEEYLSDLMFEFWVDKPLSNKYIVNWEYATS